MSSEARWDRSSERDPLGRAPGFSSAGQVIMEMTGSFELNKPMLLAAVIAFGFSRRFGQNIYDTGACVGCSPAPSCWSSGRFGPASCVVPHLLPPCSGLTASARPVVRGCECFRSARASVAVPERRLATGQGTLAHEP